MEEHGIPLDNVVQHNRWNGKDCPKTIRATAGAWEAFLVLCNGEPVDAELSAAVDKLAAKGLSIAPIIGRAGTTPPRMCRHSSSSGRPRVEKGRYMT